MPILVLFVTAAVLFNSAFSLRVSLRTKLENMHTATEHQLQLITSNQNTHNTLFNVHLSRTGNVIAQQTEKRFATADLK